MKRKASVLILALFFSVLAVSLFFGAVQASTDVSGIPKPSIPEFTLKFVDHSYDVQPTYSIDPYTGKNVTTKAGYHVENKSIEVTIKNQPFTSYRNENNSLVGLRYNIRVKGYFKDWYPESSYDSDPQGYIYRSDSDYTVVAYGLGGNNGSDFYDRRLGEISAGGRVDFQVKALIGYYTKVYGTPVPGIPGGTPYHRVFTGESSGWSNTQTITIPASTASPSGTASAWGSPQTLQLGVIIGMVIIIVVLLVYFKRRNH